MLPPVDCAVADLLALLSEAQELTPMRSSAAAAMVRRCLCILFFLFLELLVLLALLVFLEVLEVLVFLEVLAFLEVLVLLDKLERLDML